MTEKILFVLGLALLAVRLAAPAGADPGVPPVRRSVRDFLVEVRAAGITGSDPAMIGDGYDVCWSLWNGRSPAAQVVAGVQRDHPQLTADQADRFVRAAYSDLCPVPGAYDWWAYGTGG